MSWNHIYYGDDSSNINLEHQSHFCVLGPWVEGRVLSGGGCTNWRGKVELRAVAFLSIFHHISLPGVISVQR